MDENCINEVIYIMEGIWVFDIVECFIFLDWLFLDFLNSSWKCMVLSYCDFGIFIIYGSLV